MSRWGRRRREAPSSPPPQSRLVIPPRTAQYGPDTAMRLHAIYRAVTVTAGVVAMMPAQVYAGNRRVEEWRGLCATATDRDTLYLLALSMALHGTGLLDKGPGATIAGGLPYRRVLDPRRVQWDPTRREWSVLEDTGHVERWPADRVRAITSTPTFGGPLGLGPLQAARSTIALSEDLDTYAATAYPGTAAPSGYLSTDQTLPRSRTDEMRQAWMDRYGATAAEGPAVLSGGLTYHPVTLSPVDAAYVESVGMTVQQVARLWGIPPRLLLAAASDSSSYQNLQDDLRLWISSTLVAGYAEPIGEALTADRWPELPGDRAVRLSADVLLRGDLAARVSVAAEAVGAGLITPEEWRASEGLPPIGQPLPVTDPGVLV